MILGLVRCTIPGPSRRILPEKDRCQKPRLPHWRTRVRWTVRLTLAEPAREAARSRGDVVPPRLGERGKAWARSRNLRSHDPDPVPRAGGRTRLPGAMPGNKGSGQPIRLSTHVQKRGQRLIPQDAVPDLGRSRYYGGRPGFRRHRQRRGRDDGRQDRQRAVLDERAHLDRGRACRLSVGGREYILLADGGSLIFQYSKGGYHAGYLAFALPSK